MTITQICSTANKTACHKLCVIKPVLCSFNFSLPWKYISSHVHILEFCTLFYTCLYGFIDINSCKMWIIYTQSIPSRSAPRLRTTTQFLDSCTKFSSQITWRVSRHNDAIIFLHGVHFVLCPKQGNKIRGVVVNRVCILGFFVVVVVNRVRVSNPHLYPNTGRVSSGGCCNVLGPLLLLWCCL